jgi:hypothetical protein
VLILDWGRCQILAVFVTAADGHRCPFKNDIRNEMIEINDGKYKYSIIYLYFIFYFLLIGNNKTPK